MKVVMTEGCDLEWVRSLSPWQLENLAAAFRQGKGLPDRTNHGSDMRWKQAGCKTRNSQYGRYWSRTGQNDRHAHERIIIRRTDYGYEKIGVRRTRGFTINPDTGEIAGGEVWVVVWVWYVSEDSSASFPPHRTPPAMRRRPR